MPNNRKMARNYLVCLLILCIFIYWFTPNVWGRTRVQNVSHGFFFFGSSGYKQMCVCIFNNDTYMETGECAYYNVYNTIRTQNQQQMKGFGHLIIFTVAYVHRLDNGQKTCTYMYMYMCMYVCFADISWAWENELLVWVILIFD